MREEDLLKYDNVEIERLKHITEISCYNSNYYIGLLSSGNVANDLLYAHSDDDDTTEWFLVEPYGYIFIGYSYTSNYPDEKINYSECRYT